MHSYLKELTDDEVVEIVAPRLLAAAVEVGADGADIIESVHVLSSVLTFLSESGVVLASRLKTTQELYDQDVVEVD